MNEGKAERIRQEVGPALYDACPNIIYLEEMTYPERVAKLAEKHTNYFEEHIDSDDDYNFEMTAMITAIFHYVKKAHPHTWDTLIEEIGNTFITIAAELNDKENEQHNCGE